MVYNIHINYKFGIDTNGLQLGLIFERTEYKRNVKRMSLTSKDMDTIVFCSGRNKYQPSELEHT